MVLLEKKPSFINLIERIIKEGFIKEGFNEEGINEDGIIEDANLPPTLT